MPTTWTTAKTILEADAAQQLRDLEYRKCGIYGVFEPKVQREISAYDILPTSSLILVRDHGEVLVGTARLALPNPEVASSSDTLFGLELEQEFDLAQLAVVRAELGEVARVCVAKSHLGTGSVVLRLYEGLHSASARQGVRYWVGGVDCQTSLPEEAALMHQLVVGRNLESDRFRVQPRSHGDASSGMLNAPKTQFYSAEEWERAERGHFDDLPIASTIQTFARRLGARCVGVPARHPSFPRFVMPMVADLTQIPPATLAKFSS